MKPEVRINLNIDVKVDDNTPPDRLNCQMEDALTRAYMIANKIKSYEPAPPTSPPKGEAPPPPPTPKSRHAVSVAANQRISEAIDNINSVKELYPDNVELHLILNRIKLILLA